MIQVLFENCLSGDVLERTTWLYECGVDFYYSYWVPNGYMFEFYGPDGKENATAFKLRFGITCTK